MMKGEQASKESVIKAAYIQTHEHPLLLFALHPNLLALGERISDRKFQSSSKSEGLWGDFPWKTQTYQACACLRQGKGTSDNLRLAQVSECLLSGNPTGLQSFGQDVLLNHRFKWPFRFYLLSRIQNAKIIFMHHFWVCRNQPRFSYCFIQISQSSILTS